MRLFFFIGKEKSSFNFVDYRNLINAIIISIDNKKAFNESFIVSDYITLEDAINIIKNVKNIKLNFPRFNGYLIRKIIFILSYIPYFPINIQQFDGLFTKVKFSTQKIEDVLDYKRVIKIDEALKQTLKN